MGRDGRPDNCRGTRAGRLEMRRHSGAERVRLLLAVLSTLDPADVHELFIG